MSTGKARAGFDLDLKYGQESENELAKIFGDTKVEVKRDERCLQTGNLFIELETIIKNDSMTITTKASGFAVTQAEWWAFVFRPGRFLLVRADDLNAYIDRARQEDRMVWGGDNNRFRGALIPIKWIIKE